jgi:hypothetical protein
LEERRKLYLMLGMNLRMFLPVSTGPIWMESTICLGTRISIFLVTVVLAGLRELLLLLLIDLIS